MPTKYVVVEVEKHAELRSVAEPENAENAQQKVNVEAQRENTYEKLAMTDEMTEKLEMPDYTNAKLVKLERTDDAYENRCARPTSPTVSIVDGRTKKDLRLFCAASELLQKAPTNEDPQIVPEIARRTISGPWDRLLCADAISRHFEKFGTIEDFFDCGEDDFVIIFSNIGAADAARKEKVHCIRGLHGGNRRICLHA